MGTSSGINNVRQRIMEIQKKIRMLTPQRVSPKPDFDKSKIFSLKDSPVQKKSVTSGEDVKDAGSVVISSTVGNSVDTKKLKNPYSNIVAQKARQHGLPENLLRAIIDQESGWRKDAVSSKGAMGLMQLMPGTADSLGVKDPYSPEQNIDGGVRYLKNLLGQFPGDIVKALAAYNAGVQAVESQQGVPKYEETQDYVKKIIERYMKYSGVSSK